MKYWKTIELPEWETAAGKIYEWMKSDTKILASKHFWNTVNHVQLTESVAPELGAALDALGVKCEYAALITAYSMNSESIHVDNMSFALGTRARLNIPIKNTAGSYTAFYSAPNGSIRRYIMPNKLIAWLVDRDDCIEQTRVEMLQPTIIRISEPHAVFINKNAEQPRITLTMRLSQDPVRWLEEDNNENV